MNGRALRVALLAGSRYPVREPFAGGMEAHTWQLAQGLRARGHEVLLFAGPGSDPGLGARELGVRPLALSPAARADVSMAPDEWLAEHHAYLQVMLGLARGAYGEVDVVHNNCLHHLPVAMAEALTVPVVTTLHTPPTPWLEPAVALAQDAGIHFLAVSGATRAAWRHVTDSQVVHNGVDTDLWRYGPGGPGVAWSGRIVPEKAPHLAARIARAAGVRLRLAGPVIDRAYYTELVVPELGDGVEHVGHLAHAELRDLVATSAATLVTPVWEEPYGLVVAESLACGTPVCAFGRGGVPELLRPAWGRVVPADDVPAAAELLRETMRLDRRRARAAAVEHLSVGRMLDAYEAVYRAALGERAAA